MKELKLYLGPNHPGMHGNFSVHMYVDGDTIVRARPMPGMLHRGFEKLMERRLWMNNLALIPRICVPEPDINEMVYAMAIEELAGIEVPEKAHWIRMIILELARIANHLMSLGGIGGPVGLYTGPNWGLADRDLILDIFEEITGARVYHMYIVPGGVRKDLREETIEKIKSFLDYLENRLPEYEDLILKNSLFQRRTKDKLLLPAEVVWELGVTGIGMRSAVGEAYDIRKVDPYARYDQVEFSVPTANYSDGYTRVYFKYLETYQSIKIIRQVLEKMPQKGKVWNKISNGSALRWRVPKGQVYTHVECARGEYGYYMVSEGEDKPYRVAVRGASYPQGLLGVEKYLPGTRIEDAALWMDTMGVCPPEIDR
ncbi:NADH-quinone oxidoreductase subunit D [Petrotoga sp. HKA.pet.4.5]|uniref:NADH-quinone oxidoreductase subunit D n=1 Tax=unclassified Petrotoga TaxID=2620614 RepID=UPI000EF161A8|nr:MULTISPECIES: NADH-quinone oxidoreductase subunit D [unclassified Petrotoga]RLL84535.1 NADH-quinone oxidoreductase subunit D [Petrotoga sp. Shatin.DS.tank11.9.2.9.3]RLL89563.1 NADH-quinone oxidoreductase subunit D [Petrotoga sp. HKA.pet.4.5]